MDAQTVHNQATPLLADTREQPRRRTGGVHLPFITLALVSGLLAIGITTLFSASANAKPDNPYFYIERQLLFIAIATVAGIATAFAPMNLLRRYSWWLLAGLVVLLVLTLVPGIGVMVKGSRRWLDLGPMNLQASELAKVGLVFVLAHYFASNQSRVRDLFRGFLIPCFVTGIIFLLIFRQPDFGTAALCGLLGFTLIFLAGVPLKYISPITALGALGFAVMTWLDPVRRARITSFVNLQDSETRMDSGYQLWQAILAFGTGGVSGVGIGNGRQQLAFLPEAHNDFILAITGEEMGLIATLGVVVLFIALFITGILQIRRAPNLFHYLLLAGCYCTIAFQAMINLGVVTGLFPTKGMSLPFVSYGGSNLLLMGIIIGLIFNLHRSANRLNKLPGKRELPEALP
jgi:cell division protein FtsW